MGTLVTWTLLWIIHAIGCVTVVVAGCWLPFSGVHWSVWFVLGTLTVQMVCDKETKCILTTWENELRRRMGWEPIQGFVEHYLGKHHWRT